MDVVDYASPEGQRRLARQIENAARIAQALCLHAKWEEIGWSMHHGDIGDSCPRGGEPRQLLQCPACGLMRWADEPVPVVVDLAVDPSRSTPG